MIEIVVALLMIVNGEIKEHRIQDSMSTCLKAKRIAMRSGTSRIDYQCNKCKKEFEAKEEFDMFCSDDCKQEALADLDKDSDECLSCQ
jgi:hypothetical protein